MMVVELIERKRDGGQLTPEEWREAVRACLAAEESAATGRLVHL